MPIKYSCFISYRHTETEEAQRFTEDLYNALSGQLEPLLSQKVFLDDKRLQGGQFLKKAISGALCQSACMVMIFTPQYFDKEHTYCAREYKGMLELEQKRLQLLGEDDTGENGFIIPIIFRGQKSLPPEIKDERLYHNFSRFNMSDPLMNRHPKYAPLIQDIADYIAGRCYSLLDLPEDSLPSCDEFDLPEDEDIEDWLADTKAYIVRSFVRS